MEYVHSSKKNNNFDQNSYLIVLTLGVQQLNLDKP